MKNVRTDEMKKCIFKHIDYFDFDANEAFGGNGEEVEVLCDYEGITITKDDETLSHDEIVKGLSMYYEVEVTSIHIDDCMEVGVWICYKDA